jgi:hypothetical protein
VTAVVASARPIDPVENSRDEAILRAVMAALAELADLPMSDKLVAAEVIATRIAEEERGWHVAAGLVQ